MNVNGRSKRLPEKILQESISAPLEVSWGHFGVPPLSHLTPRKVRGSPLYFIGARRTKTSAKYSLEAG
jgi:hypothetical protein